MLPTEEILRTALAEHDAQEGEAVDRSEVIVYYMLRRLCF
jgi:hypothetical protein